MSRQSSSPLRIMTEASSSLASGYMLKAIREAGHIPVGSDITPWTAALGLAKDNIVVPPYDDPSLWTVMEKKLNEHHIDVVIPSFDRTLLAWSERKSYFAARGITVIVSPPETIATFTDKWLSHQFFTANQIPCPPTSLDQVYPLLKPRIGSGAKGIRETDQQVDMTGYVSQAVIKGTEYTVDCLFDREGAPVYIVPRRRLMVHDGKSTQGEVVNMPPIESYIRRAATTISLTGQINFQCFQTEDGQFQFIEVNPRLAGGMALGFAATENWIRLLIKNFIYGESIAPGPIKFGTRMIRYYAEHFVYPA